MWQILDCNCARGRVPPIAPPSYVAQDIARAGGLAKGLACRETSAAVLQGCRGIGWVLEVLSGGPRTHQAPEQRPARSGHRAVPSALRGLERDSKSGISASRRWNSKVLPWPVPVDTMSLATLTGPALSSLVVAPASFTSLDNGREGGCNESDAVRVIQASQSTRYCSA